MSISIRLPNHLEKALILVPKNPKDLDTVKCLRELQKIGYLKIHFKSGWGLTVKGEEYLRLLKPTDFLTN